MARLKCSLSPKWSAEDDLARCEVCPLDHVAGVVQVLFNSSASELFALY